MCNEADDDYLAALKLIPDWFVTKKMTQKLLNALYVDKDSGNVVFPCNETDILNIDMNNISLDNNFDEDDALLLLSDLWLAVLNLKNTKHLKNISEELMSIAWHPKRR